MRFEEVPQDDHLFGKFRELIYARDEMGILRPVKSAGWDVKSIANSQFWDELFHKLTDTLQAVRNRQVSPISFYMTLHQMDVAMLAQYAGVSRWTVRKHLKPKYFDKLSLALLNRYASIFKITSDQLLEYEIEPDLTDRAATWAYKYQQATTHGF